MARCPEKHSCRTLPFPHVAPKQSQLPLRRTSLRYSSYSCPFEQETLLNLCSFLIDNLYRSQGSALVWRSHQQILPFHRHPLLPYHHSPCHQSPCHQSPSPRLPSHQSPSHQSPCPQSPCHLHHHVHRPLHLIPFLHLHRRIPPYRLLPGHCSSVSSVLPSWHP